LVTGVTSAAVGIVSSSLANAVSWSFRDLKYSENGWFLQDSSPL
jgi:hypothetical protein